MNRPRASRVPKPTNSRTLSSDEPYVAKVAPDVAARVFRRDGMCVAYKLGAGSLCADAWGNAIMAHDLAKMELCHVKYEPRMGKRATSTEAHLVVGCPGHHRGMGRTRQWIDQHVDLIIDYLLQFAPGPVVTDDDDDGPFDTLPW